MDELDWLLNFDSARRSELTNPGPDLTRQTASTTTTTAAATTGTSAAPARAMSEHDVKYGSSGVQLPDSAGSKRLAKACSRCRQQKVACKAGSDGDYPCSRCEDVGVQCVLLERQRPTPPISLAERMTRQEDLTMTLDERVKRLEEAAFRAQMASSSMQTWAPPEETYQTVPAPAPSKHNTSPFPASLSTSMVDANVAQVAIQELEHGEEISNLGPDARMLTLSRTAEVTSPNQSGSKKRKRGNLKALCKIAFATFCVRCLPMIYFFDPADPTFTDDIISERSQFLYWVVVAVGSRETEDLLEVYEVACNHTIRLFRETLGGPFGGYWDLCGALVYNKWLSAICPIGHIVDLGYMMGLHRVYDNIPVKSHPSEDDVKYIRLWLTITIQDYFYSISSGCPPHYPHRNSTFTQAKWLLSLRNTLPNDKRLLATYEYQEIAQSIQDSYMRDSSAKNWEQEIQERLEATEGWFKRWEAISQSFSDEAETFSMLTSIKVNYHAAKLGITSVGLQGLRTAQDVTPEKLKYIQLSVSTARAACRLCADEFQPPAVQYVAEATIFSFLSAAVFLLKVVRLLPTLGQTIPILSEVGSVADVLDSLHSRRHGQFLRQMLDHLAAGLHTHPATRLPSPDSKGDTSMFGFDNDPAGVPDFDRLTASIMEWERSLDVDHIQAWMTIPENEAGEDGNMSQALDPFNFSVPFNGF